MSGREQAARNAIARVLWDQKRMATAEASGRAARIRGAKTYDRNFQADNLAKAIQSGAVMGTTLADAFGNRQPMTGLPQDSQETYTEDMYNG
jgi:hypothetical protein